MSSPLLSPFRIQKDLQTKLKMPSRIILEAEKDPTLHLPRILCLHGGGSNAKIFRAQCRKLNLRLQSYFRLVFADAPFLSQAGPCVLSVYAEWAPFRRWLRWTPDHPELRADAAAEMIEDSLQQAMDEDDRKGATGEWVGLLGFSQGAKMGASLLFHQQVLSQQQQWTEFRKRANFRFAVLLAGRGPLVSLDPDLIMTPALHDAASMSLSSYDSRYLVYGRKREDMLRIPTLHVHGLQDSGLELHRRFLHEFCERGSTRLVQWDGDHRVPLKHRDVAAVAEQIFALAKQTGVLEDIAHNLI